MKASVGDRIVIASNRVEGPLRDGRVVACRHEDGSPPYDVQWSDTGKVGLFFPGPDALVEHSPADDPGRRATGRTAGVSKTWSVEVDVFESGDDTTAHAVLASELPGVEGRGSAHRNPHDADQPLIGDEVAVARALHRLADRLLGTASDGISAVEGRPVELRH
jgi:hypothetical protein